MIKKELTAFIIVGLSTVAIDFVLYHGLLRYPVLPVAAAKTISFLVGTGYSYLVNRAWTFGHKTPRRGSAVRFLLVYLVGLAANVLTNGFLLYWLNGLPDAIAIAFICATGLSAVMNFAGMKWVVFTAPLSSDLS
ncbi:MAG: GtrA family protein [Janthinobacterium lividum]